MNDGGSQINITQAMNYLQTAVGHGKGILTDYQKLYDAVIAINQIWITYPESDEHKAQQAMLDVCKTAFNYIKGALNTLNNYMSISIQSSIPAASRQEIEIIEMNLTERTLTTSVEAPGISDFQKLVDALEAFVEIERVNLFSDNDSIIDQYSHLWFLGRDSGKMTVSNAAHTAADAIRFQFQNLCNQLKKLKEKCSAYVNSISDIEQRLGTSLSDAVETLSSTFENINFDIRIGNVECLLDQTLSRDGYSSIENMDIIGNKYLGYINGETNLNDFNPEW